MSQKRGTRTLVVCHAQFLPPGIWEQVMWGTPSSGEYGILSKSADYFLQSFKGYPRNDSMLYLCSGIPVCDGNREDSPNALEYLLDHLHELPIFETQLDEEGRNAFRSWLIKHTILNERAQTTEEEARDFVSFALDEKVDTIVAFTFPKHAPRALHVDYLAKISLGYTGELLNTCSDTSPPECGPNEVAILEKSHRHDMPKEFANLHLIGRGIITLLRKLFKTPATFSKFEKDFWELMEKYNNP